ncbi:MAG TPA: 50S ribosomal protein L29 [Candidatus Paceibacterota bacterium]
MKPIDLQKKTAEELQRMAAEERVKLQQLRFDLPGGKVKNVREIRQIRRDIARILTLLKQKQ